MRLVNVFQQAAHPSTAPTSRILWPTDSCRFEQASVNREASLSVLGGVCGQGIGLLPCEGLDDPTGFSVRGTMRAAPDWNPDPASIRTLLWLIEADLNERPWWKLSHRIVNIAAPVEPRAWPSA